MRLLKVKSAISTLVVILITNSTLVGQAPSPGATMNKIRSSKSSQNHSRSSPVLTIVANTNPTKEQAAVLQIDSIFTSCKASNDCSWSATPWPFVGLIIDPSTGAISGKEIATNQALVTVTAVNSEGKTFRDQIFIAIVPNGTTILTSHLPSFPAGEYFYQQLEAGPIANGPFTWTPINGSDSGLLQGVNLNALGVISGTPLTAGTYSFSPKVTDIRGNQFPAPAALPLIIDKAPGCGNTKYSSTPYFNGWFPLSKKIDVNPLGKPVQMPSWHPIHRFPTDADVQCYYSMVGLVSIVGQVQYLYGFEGGANTISADLINVQMPAPFGVQVSFGSSITGGGTSTTSTNNSNPSGSTQTSVTAALQSVEAGGNFFIHALYPIAQYVKPNLSAFVYGDPRIGFGFNGFANQSTLSEATEKYYSVPIELYGSFDGIGKAGGFYGDYRVGFESVPLTFSQAAGLNNHNFLLNQISFGFNFAGMFRIGTQKYWGPPAAFNAPTESNSFNKWHFVLQFAPTNSAKQ